MSDISKLPKWAQERIRDLERERDVAVQALSRYTDNQTESPVYFDELLCVGKSPTKKRVYVHTDNLTFHHADIFLNVQLHHKAEHIDLRWSGGRRMGVADVALIPQSFQHIRLVPKQFMQS